MNQQPDHETPALPRAQARAIATRRMLALATAGQLTEQHKALYAEMLEVSERTIRRWLHDARTEQRHSPRPQAAFTFTPELRVRLTYHRGDTAALYRELAAAPGAVLPSLRTVQRAARAQITAGERAGMRKGERERRKYDVYLRRPPTHRNDAWEADHVEAPVQVWVHGRLRKPWITWFIDTATSAVAGAAVTAGRPSSESIMAALRAAITTAAPYGPVGALPARVRIDRGKDFLSRVLTDALRAFAVPVITLPPYASYLKGSVEAMNHVIEQQLFAQLPCYTHRPRTLNNQSVDPDQAALPFEVFVEKVLTWILKWNTEHTMPSLAGRTPAQAWLTDPTPVFEPPAADLVHLTLRDDGKTRVISTKGVHWNNADYVGQFMHGRVGTRVRLRHMPHHTEQIEIFDADSGRHLGAAYKSDSAPADKVAEVLRVREARARRQRRELKAAEKLRTARYAAVTVPGPPVALETLTTAQADAEIRRERGHRLRELARPDVIPLSEAPEGWARPRPRAGGTRGRGEHGQEDRP